MDFSNPTEQPNVETQLSLPLGVPAGKKKKKIAAVKRVRSPATDKASELILERILEHVKNVQNESKEPPRALEELTALLAGTIVEDSPLADASVKVEPLTYGTGDSTTVEALDATVSSEAEAGSSNSLITDHVIRDRSAENPNSSFDSQISISGTGAPSVGSSSTAPMVGSLGVDSSEGITSPVVATAQDSELATFEGSEQSFAPESDGAARLNFEGATQPQAPQDALSKNTDDIVTPSDGIEVLVRMAKQGELDPKAVDIVDVTDKFLKLIAAAPKENLRQSGKILFHACVLLRMKAEALLSFSSDDDDFAGGDDFLDFEDGDGSMDSSNTPRQITFADLEKAIVRRTQRRRVRPRPVTLDELIEALREAERIEKTRADKKPKAVIQLAGQHSVEGMEDLLDLAHDEDIETTIDKIEQLLAQILKFGENIELMALVKKLDSHEDWVDAFLASLFLSNAGKIMLEQSEFYGPLYIALCGGQPSVLKA